MSVCPTEQGEGVSYVHNINALRCGIERIQALFRVGCDMAHQFHHLLPLQQSSYHESDIQMMITIMETVPQRLSKTEKKKMRQMRNEAM